MAVAALAFAKFFSFSDFLRSQADPPRATAAPQTPSGSLKHGLALIGGEGVKADLHQGVQLLARIAVEGRKEAAKASFELGEIFRKGRSGISSHAGKARLYLELAAEQGHTKALLVLGRALLRGDGLPIDQAAGVEILEKVSKKGKVRGDAAFSLGSFLLKGGGPVQPDPKRARSFLEAAQKQGIKSAATVLGRAMLRGQGLPANEKKGLGLLEAQLKNGQSVAGAAFELGLFYWERNKPTPANTEKARKFLERAAQSGNEKAAILLSRALIEGERISADPKAGVAVLERYVAANKDARASLGELGRLYLKGGEGIAANPEKAIRYLERASNAGDADASVVLGRAFLRGEGVAANPELGQRILDRQIASERKVADAAFELGRFFLNGGTEGFAASSSLRSGDDKEDVHGFKTGVFSTGEVSSTQDLAFFYLSKSVTAGHKDAPFLLGRALLLGKGVARDVRAGQVLLDEEILRGKNPAKAAYELGLLYSKGSEGVPADSVKARSYFDMASAAGHEKATAKLVRDLLGKGTSDTEYHKALGMLEAQFEHGKNVGLAGLKLGVAYLRGERGTSKDPKKAVKFLDAAVTAGEAEAAWILGRALLAGRDVPQDSARGISLLERAIAANKRVGDASYELGRFYLRGDEKVPADAGRAKAYLEDAVTAGHLDAEFVLGRALASGDRMPPDLSKASMLLENVASRDPRKAGTAFMELGRAYLRQAGGSSQRAKAYLERSVQAGNVAALEEMGSAALAGKFGENQVRAAESYFRQAVAAGSESAVPKVAGIYLYGKAGTRRDVRKGIQMLEAGARNGSLAALRELMVVSAKGIGRHLPRDVKKARSALRDYRAIAPSDDVLVYELIIDASESAGLTLRRQRGAFSQLMRRFENLPGERRAQVARLMFSVNRPAAVFIAQSVLKAAGLYDGPVDGIIQPGTLSAMERACRSGGKGKCGPKSFHHDTVGFIALNFS